MIVASGCVETGGGGAGTGGGGGSPDPSSCTPDGDRLVLAGALDLVSTNAEAWEHGGGLGVVSVRGDDEGGEHLFWRRAGDVGDAAISETGTFDVSEYPNNIQIIRADLAAKVITGGLWGTAGTLTITEAEPVLRVTFHLESLREQNTEDEEAGPGPAIDGTLDGCIAAPLVPEEE